jgi:FG-GAP-like repeat/FG-GAP repeat
LGGSHERKLKAIVMWRSFTKVWVLMLVLSATARTSDRFHAVPSIGYSLPLSFPVGAAARLVAHADLNGDGKEDLIFAGQTPRMQERTVEILEGNGDGTFHQGATINLQKPTLAIAIADLNSDGKPDLILLHPGVSILLNTTPHPGAPVSFGAEQSLVGGFGPALAAADLNGDGKAEVLLGTIPTRHASDEQGTLRIASAPVFIDANHHSGSAPAIDIPIPGVPVSIVVSDFDGDGKPDVAVGFTGPLHERRGGVAVLLNRTESSTTPIHFADPLLVQFDHAVDFITRADLNGDGRNDIFAAWCSGGEEPCAAVSLLNRLGAEGGISFTSQNVSLGVKRASNWILQDVNHDGKPDLLFLNRLSGLMVPYGTPAEIVVALGFGDGKFAPPRTFSAPTSNTLGMILADFNRDGQPDLAALDAASDEGGRIRVLLGRKDGGFDAPASLILGFAPTTVIPFSDHGRTAGFVVTDVPQTGLTSSSKAGHTARVFAARSFDPPYALPYTVTAVPDGAIAIGDLNDDGRTEMIVATASGIQVYDLEGKGRNHPVQAAKFQPTGDRFATTPQRAILQDLNGDGKPDLIVGNGYDRSLAVYMNTGTSASGGFSFAEPVQLSWCPRGAPPLIIKSLPMVSLQILSADLNADRKPDLVVNGYCGLSVILNRTSDHGPVAFDSPVAVKDAAGQPLRPQVVALADVNRDGKADLIVTENGYTTNVSEPSAVDVLLNETTSSPSFRLAQHLTIGKHLASVAIADFDQDGWPDMAIIDTVEGTLTFLLNDGHWKSRGAFTIHSSFTVMPAPQQLLVIDRPGGGLPRLLLRNHSSAAIVQ